MNRQLSQQEIDAVFQNSQPDAQGDSARQKVTVFDFRRPDRIAKSQLRAIYQLHENFVRSIVSSLSAYLRTYVVVNLVSVEQLSYAEFLEGLPSPTCMASLGLKPYEGSAVMEINPSLVFPILEILLGGTGKVSSSIQREVTEIEQSLMDGFLRIVLHDLRDAWKTVASIDFTIQSVDTEPQFLKVMAPNEAVVAVGIEMRIGESAGLMKIALPSLMIKMMRQKFDQQWSVRKSEATAEEQNRVWQLIQPSRVAAEVRLPNQKIRTSDLLALQCGDVLSFDLPVDHALDMALNGRRQFLVHIVSTGRKRAAMVERSVSA